MRIVGCKKRAEDGGLEGSMKLEGNKAGSFSAIGLLVSSYIMFLSVFGAC